MSTIAISLAHVKLMLKLEILQEAHEKHKRRKYASSLPQSHTEIGAALRRASANGGVPATLEEMKKGKNSHRLALYIYPRYSLNCFPSSKGDAYDIKFIQPISRRDYDQIARNSLLIASPQWSMYEDHHDIGQKTGSNGWDQLIRAWNMLEERMLTASGVSINELTPAQEKYLSTVYSLVDYTEDFERYKTEQQSDIGYSRVESVGEDRTINRDIYLFHLQTPFQGSEKDTLCLQDNTNIQGQVFALEGQKLTIKFNEEIDYNDIPQPGRLALVANTVVFKKQREAIRRLEKGQARNKHLLQVLVEQRYQAYIPDTTARPHRPLNVEQERAFHKAIAVPDLLLILGPPGTGKTRTITEIVRNYSTKQLRVLVTSKTHKAVDNVLKLLPSELIMIRVGHEDKVDEKSHAWLLDNQARELQKFILQQTEQQSVELKCFSQGKSILEHWLNQLDNHAGKLAEKERLISQASRVCQEIERAVILPIQPHLEDMKSWSALLEDWINRRQRFLWKLQHSPLFTAKSEQNVFLRRLFQGGRAIFDFYIKRLQQGLANTQKRFRRMQYARRRLEEETLQKLASNRTYTEASLTFRQVSREYQDIVQATGELVAKLERSVKGLAPLQVPAKETLHATTVQAFYQHYRQTINILEQRSIVLSDWRDELKERKQELYEELCQYADVIGATCIGIATSPYLKYVDFPLAIVDEAGQIALPDLLVPLVRAEKSVLVGDHQQLPPYVDNELDDWLKTIAPEDWPDSNLTAAQIRALLTKSTFEQLFTANPDEKHYERFIWQHRMPKVVADFAAQHFYEKSLETAPRAIPYHDPVFHSPFVFIDLPKQPQSSRQKISRGNERSATDRYAEEQLEGIAGFGWKNRLEAELAARIATIYEREGNDWVIIVPFRAQARLIRESLKRYLGNSNFNQRVATVDSFQGGERQKIIYSFTRSNIEGKVGFLKELRRLNVALTRAQEQLVLIGDMDTLSHAQNQGFRNLAQALQEHVQKHGEYISCTECEQRLSLLEKRVEAE